MTGIWAFSANSFNSLNALEIITPWPASITGLCALLITSAAFNIWASGAEPAGLYPGRSSSCGQLKSILSPSNTSFGISTRTGPGLPERAI